MLRDKIRNLISNIIFTVMHVFSGSSFSRKRITIPTPRMSKDPMKNHLMFDYYFIHGNKEPLKLYRKGKLIESIKENIRSYPK